MCGKSDYLVRYICILMLFVRAFIKMGAGLSVGLSGLAAGVAIGIVGDAGVRGSAQQPRVFVCIYEFILGFHINSLCLDRSA